MSIAAKIANLKAQGPVSIRISTLGGNDRFRVGSKKGMDKYVENYVKPLFKMVDEVGGSGRSKTYDADLKNKAVDEKYRAAAEEMGWEIVASVPEEGRIEATAKTPFVGFKDDVVIRVRGGDNGTEVDVRSKSRFGQGDVGVNAARIRAYREVLTSS